MNRTHRVLALAALTTTFVMPAAQASDGTVNFNGKVFTETCMISVNGGTNVGTVTLPTLSTTTLGAAGATGGRTSFTVSLSGCAAGSGILDFVTNGLKDFVSASAYFEGGAGVDPASHNILNTTGSATGVQLQLVDAGGTAIKAGDSQQSKVAGTQFSGKSVSGTMNYGVQYVATTATTPGTVVGAVTYSIIYN